MSSRLEPIFLHVAPGDIALVKFLFESYEGVGVVRTMDRHAAVIVVLVSGDFLDVARGILTSLHETIAIEEIPPPANAGEDWLLRVMREEERQNEERQKAKCKVQNAK